MNYFIFSISLLSAASAALIGVSEQIPRIMKILSAYRHLSPWRGDECFQNTLENTAPFQLALYSHPSISDS
ncbi:hypothetical protein DMENIID0001_037830 [Sergentomyia squamirostris]